MCIVVTVTLISGINLLVAAASGGKRSESPVLPPAAAIDVPDIPAAIVPVATVSIIFYAI